MNKKKTGAIVAGVVSMLMIGAAALAPQATFTGSLQRLNMPSGSHVLVGCATGNGITWVQNPNDGKHGDLYCAATPSPTTTSTTSTSTTSTTIPPTTTTTTPTPPSSVPCTLSLASQACWAFHTGVQGYANDVGLPWNGTGTDPNMLGTITGTFALTSNGLVVTGSPSELGPTSSTTRPTITLNPGKSAPDWSSTTVSHITVVGCIHVESPNTHLIDVKIIGPNVCQFGNLDENNNANNPGFTADYVTIVGNQNTPGFGGGDTCIDHQSDSWHINFSDISMCGKDYEPVIGFLSNSYLHDVTAPAGSNDHLDAIFSWVTVFIDHSWIAMGGNQLNFGPTGGYTAALLFHGAPDSSGLSIVNSYLDGTGPVSAGFDMEGPGNGSGTWTVTGNVFGTPGAGNKGIATFHTGSSAPVIWSNNHYANGTVVSQP